MVPLTAVYRSTGGVRKNSPRRNSAGSRLAEGRGGVSPLRLQLLREIIGVSILDTGNTTV